MRRMDERVWLAILGATAIAACADGDWGAEEEVSVAATAQTLSEAPVPTMRLLGRYVAEGGFDSAAAESVSYDANSARLFVSNAGARRIDILDISEPSVLTLVGTIDTAPFGAHANSVAASGNGFIAAAIESEDPQAAGTVAFFDTAGGLLSTVEVGAMPDMVVFTPNRRAVLVANEGEPSNDYRSDPEGSVSIVRLRSPDSPPTQRDVRTVSFAGWNEASLDESIRIRGPHATVARDLEPESVTVSSDSRTAWVTLQENNAVAIVDIRRARVRDIVGLGFRDHSLSGNGLDASDKDDAINITTHPVLGMPLPDGIASFRRGGRHYLITANEGDVREYDAFDEETRCKKLELDPAAYPEAEALQQNAALGRLSCSTVDGDVDGDGDVDQIHSYGSRSFSILDARGNLVFDSGDEIEQTIAALDPEHFNSNDDDNDSFDSRSDNKGPEPEGVAVGRIGYRTYAFIGLERIGGILMYDVTRPSCPAFVQYLNTRIFAGVPELGTAGDLAPEGLAFIGGDQSPSGVPLLAVAFEMSGTTAVFAID